MLLHAWRSHAVRMACGLRSKGTRPAPPPDLPLAPAAQLDPARTGPDSSPLARRRAVLESVAGLDAPRPPPFDLLGLTAAHAVPQDKTDAIVRLAHSVASAPASAPGPAQLAADPGVHALVAGVFGHPGGPSRSQAKALGSVLHGDHTFASLPTGAGKTLIFQAASALLPGVTLVVSPLLALITEQVSRANELGLAASFLTSTTTTETMAHLEGKLAFAGEPGDLPCKLLYVTPERIAAPRFQDTLASLADAGLLSLVAVDEAHCMSEWGHDFRPDYARLGVVHDISPGTPILAASGTAPPKVRSDVMSMLLNTPTPSYTLVADSFDRPNLRYSIRDKGSDVNDSIAAYIATSQAGKSGIVYCLTTRDAERVAQRLGESGIRAAFYHGGMPMGERAAIQAKWSSGQVPVVCTTVAFGLGIDKPDVRFVVHHSLPHSMEAYYQQSGRAGRDGNPADCVLFFKAQDLVRAEKVQDAGPADPDAVVDRSHKLRLLDRLDDIKQYCMTLSCRRSFILQHFGQAPDAVAHDKHGPCCDVCSPSAFTQSIVHAQQPKSVPTPRRIRQKRTTTTRPSNQRQPKQSSQRQARGPTARSYPRPSSGASASGSIPNALTALDSVRRDIAKQRGIQPGHVCSVKAMRAIARARPATLDELMEVDGVSRKKAALYGDQLLAALQ